MMIILICLLTEKKSMFKADNKNVNFPTQFCLGRISKKIDAIECREVFLKGNVYEFAVDCNAFNKSDI